MLMIISNLRKLDVILATLQGKYTVSQAADILNVSERRIKQLKNNIRQEEYCANHNFQSEKAVIISEWMKVKEKDISFMEFQKMLLEYGNIKVSYASLYRILQNEKISSPCKHQKKDTLEAGTIFQVFSKSYQWFADKKQQFFLYAFLDVSGCITGIYLEDCEQISGYMKVMKQTILEFGIPETVCFQRGNSIPSSEDSLTTYGKEGVNLKDILKKMGVCIREFSFCNDKKLNMVSQRLKKEIPLCFMEEKISNLVNANKYLEQYRNNYNLPFIKQLNFNNSLFVELTDKKEIDHWFS